MRYLLTYITRITDLHGMWVHLQFVWYTRRRVIYIPLLALFTGIIMAGWKMFTIRQEQEDINCLALNVYHESRGEPRQGQYAVAQVTLNRVASPEYPDTICGAVYQQKWDRIRKRMVGAFSWTELDKLQPPRGQAWQHALKIAEDSYYGRTPDLVNGALFYHSRYIKPRWSRRKKVVARHGRHVFYR